MTYSKLPRKPVKKEKPTPKEPGEEGQAEAAGKNREREARGRIVEAFRRLGIPSGQWPDFVRDFSTDPRRWTEYKQVMIPSPFQPPHFDRLNESLQDWKIKADRAWALHRNRSVQECEDSVTSGVDEEIVEPKRVRGTGKKVPPHPEGRRRGDNTPIDVRYEWAAKYLIKVPLKAIAGADADPTTVGRVAREILGLAGWATQSARKPHNPVE